MQPRHQPATLHMAEPHGRPAGRRLRLATA
jgi:hypothetical protein